MTVLEDREWRQRSENAAFRSREARLFERKYLISNRWQFVSAA